MRDCCAWGCDERLFLKALCAILSRNGMETGTPVRNRLIASFACAASLAAAPAMAQGTGKGWAGELWPRGGLADSDSASGNGAGLLDGTLSYSFDNGITIKAEGQGNSLLGNDGYGGKVQAWWELPGLGLIGVFAENARSDSLTQRRYVAFGELIVLGFTVRGQAGYVPGDRTATNEVDGGFFGLASGGWYPSDQLGLNIGGATQAGEGLGFGNVEWMPGFMPPGTSITFDGGAGGNGFLIGVVGVRVTFGPGAGTTVRGRQVGSAPGFTNTVIGAFGDTRRSPPPTPPPSPNTGS